MAIPIEFTQATDWKPLRDAIHAFGKAVDLSEDDLLAALRAVESWRKRFTYSFTFEYQGEQITQYRYESLTWALGESFRQILLRTRRLRRKEQVFAEVRALCSNRSLGKGRESFTMLLGQYGGLTQIPALIALLDDPQVCGHAIYSLRLLGASEAADKVHPHLDSPRTWIRQEARKYFQKISEERGLSKKR